MRRASTKKKVATPPQTLYTARKPINSSHGRVLFVRKLGTPDCPSTIGTQSNSYMIKYNALAQEGMLY